jgi:hypothetical protein
LSSADIEQRWFGENYGSRWARSALLSTMPV